MIFLLRKTVPRLLAILIIVPKLRKHFHHINIPDALIVADGDQWDLLQSDLANNIGYKISAYQEVMKKDFRNSAAASSGGAG